MTTKHLAEFSTVTKLVLTILIALILSPFFTMIITQNKELLASQGPIVQFFFYMMLIFIVGIVIDWVIKILEYIVMNRYNKKHNSK